MKLTYDTQLRLNAIVHNLVETEGDTFSADEAIELRESLPHQKAKSLTFLLMFSNFFGRGATEGVTNTGQRARVDDDEKPHKLTNEPKKQWIGRYAVYRSGDDVEIEDRFNATREDQSGRWLVEFSGSTPRSLRAAAPRIWRFAGWKMTLFSYPIWKRPK